MSVNMVESPKLYNQYTIKKFNENYSKLVLLKYPIFPTGYDLEKEDPKFNDEKLDNSLSRTRSKIFEYSMCNNFQFFITLTLDKNKKDRYDLDEFIKTLGQFIRNERTRTKHKIQYVLIPEKHKDGAYHMHGLFKGISEKDLKLFTQEDNIPDKIKRLLREGHKIYNWLPYNKKFGYVTVEVVRDVESVSKYITKYIKKDIGSTVTELNKKSYYVSRGLKQAEIIKKGTFPVAGNVLTFTYENDYIKIMDLNKYELITLLKAL